MKGLLSARWVRVAGWALSVAAIAYVGWSLSREVGELGDILLDPAALATMLAAAAAYAGLSLLVALAWHLLLRAASGASPLPARRSLVIHGKTQILKYLPTNVLHVAGRYALAREAKAPHAAIAFSTVAELVLVTATALLIAAVFARPLLSDALADERMVWIASGAAAVAVAVAVGAWLSRTSRDKSDLGRLAPAALAAAGLYATFFALNGVLLGLLASRMSGGGAVFEPVLLGLTAAAWTAGFLVPGAPAGVGVREAVLIAGLEIVYPGAAAAVIALSYRVATVLGDALLAAACAMVDRRPTDAAPLR